MAKDEIGVKIKKLNKETTLTMKVNVEITQGFKIRMWVAVKLVNLAASILGCGFDIEEESEVEW